MNTSQNISVDLSGQYIPYLAYVKQHDAGRTLRFVISDNGVGADLSNAHVEFGLKKPDDTLILNPCEIEDNVAICKLTEQMTAVSGNRIPYELIVTYDDTVTRTVTGYIHIAPAIVKDEDVVSTNEFKTLTEALVGIYKFEAELEEAEAIRVESESQRVDNENERIAHDLQMQKDESIRQEKEFERQSAESERISAENDRLQAETERISAENDRIQNENTRTQSEADRVQNETDRVQAETERDAAETQRIADESERQDAETLRQTNESEREQAETDRIEAEESRVKAEADRVKEFEDKTAEFQTDLDNFRDTSAELIEASETATARANKAAEEAEKVVEHIFDDKLDENSANGVQNKVLAKEFNQYLKATYSREEPEIEEGAYWILPYSPKVYPTPPNEYEPDINAGWGTIDDESKNEE